MSPADGTERTRIPETGQEQKTNTEEIDEMRWHRRIDTELKYFRDAAGLDRYHGPAESMGPGRSGSPGAAHTARVRAVARAGAAIHAQRAVRCDAAEHGTRSRDLSAFDRRKGRRLARPRALLRLVGAAHASHPRRRSARAGSSEARRTRGASRARVGSRPGSDSNCRSECRVAL